MWYYRLRQAPAGAWDWGEKRLMEHTQIVNATELEAYAETRDSEAVIPELIWLLVTQSARDLTRCRIPYGDSINQPGWDGLLETETGFRQFIPNKQSVLSSSKCNIV